MCCLKWRFWRTARRWIQWRAVVLCPNLQRTNWFTPSLWLVNRHYQVTILSIGSSQNQGTKGFYITGSHHLTFLQSYCAWLCNDLLACSFEREFQIVGWEHYTICYGYMENKSDPWQFGCQTKMVHFRKRQLLVCSGTGIVVIWVRVVCLTTLLNIDLHLFGHFLHHFWTWIRCNKWRKWWYLMSWGCVWAHSMLKWTLNTVKFKGTWILITDPTSSSSNWILSLTIVTRIPITLMPLKFWHQTLFSATFLRLSAALQTATWLTW